MTEINELEGKKLDQAVHEMRGMKPRWEAVVYNSDESGIVATTSSAGPWFTPVELREWLEDEQNQGRLLDYHIKTTPTYPPYSRDIAQAWELDGEGWFWKFVEQRISVTEWQLEVTLCLGAFRGCVYVEVPLSDFPTTAHAYATARCRAYLKAKEGA